MILFDREENSSQRKRRRRMNDYHHIIMSLSAKNGKGANTENKKSDYMQQERTIQEKQTYMTQQTSR